jgi:dTDP-4-dehydrorhamnose 3,5-epimerase
MKAVRTSLEDAYVLEYPVHLDSRGFFVRVLDHDLLAGEIGFDSRTIVQESQSRSRTGVLRGLHGRKHLSEAKLVRCAHGRIRDVIVDLRPWSRTFMSWEAFILDDETHRQVFIPAGFAHGFEVLSDTADIHYRMDAPYAPGLDYAIRYDDADLGVTWVTDDPEISERDQNAIAFSEARPDLTLWYGMQRPKSP